MQDAMMKGNQPLAKPHIPSATTAKSAFWIMQVLTGALLLVVLGLHMTAHHFVVEGGLRNFQQVLDYVANPLIFILEIVFLVVVTIHALLGARAIILDFGIPPQRVVWVEWGLRVVALATIAYGIWLASAIQALAT